MVKNPFIKDGPLPENYSVIMKDGSIKIVSDVEKGDILMGPESCPRIVKKASMCEGVAFEVKPLKGKSFVLGEDNYICLSKVGTANNLLDIHISDFEKQSEHFKNNYKLYRSGVDFEQTKEPTIAPYFLGILLGDACLRSVPIKLSNPEPEIINYVVEAAKSMDLSTTINEISGAKCSNTFIGSNRKRNNVLREELKKLGLWGKLSHQKFIPNLYKCGTKKTRSGVMAGLIDTDGTLTECNSVRYYTTSKHLSEDMSFVAKSLGFGVSIRKPQTWPNENWKPIYAVCIFGDFSKMPLLVGRKTPQPRQSNKNVLRTGFEIKRLDRPAIYYKLEFEGNDQHFLKSDFMVMKGGKSYEM